MVHLMAAFHFILCGYKRGSYTEMYLRFSFSKVRHLKNKLLGMSALLIYLFFSKFIKYRLHLQHPQLHFQTSVTAGRGKQEFED